jgi:hypothetical protein
VRHTCATLRDQYICWGDNSFCWGGNAEGQLRTGQSCADLGNATACAFGDEPGENVASAAPKIELHWQ